MRSSRRTQVLAAVVALAVLPVVAATGCSSQNDAVAAVKAQLFTAAVHLDSKAPRMTAETAKSLYGDDGGTVCGALRDNPAGLVMGWGRAAVSHTPREESRDRVEYDRDVVRIYCPDRMGEYNKLTDRLSYQS